MVTGADKTPTITRAIGFVYPAAIASGAVCVAIFAVWAGSTGEENFAMSRACIAIGVLVFLSVIVTSVAVLSSSSEYSFAPFAFMVTSTPPIFPFISALSETVDGELDDIVLIVRDVLPDQSVSMFVLHEISFQY